MPLCDQHAYDLIAWHRTRDQQAIRSARAPVNGDLNVVYYLRWGNLIKIGTSRNVRARVQAIPHDELLAIEPGTVKLEQARHRQFAPYRASGEWFTANPDLDNLIERLISVHGQPDDILARHANLVRTTLMAHLRAS